MCFVDIYCERSDKSWLATGCTIEKLDRTIEILTSRHGYEKFEFFPPCRIGETLAGYLSANGLSL